MVIHEYGDSSLPKIVLLHPMMADARCMLRLTESMEEKYCAIIPDLSGQGEDSGEYGNARQEAEMLSLYLKKKGYTELELLMGRLSADRWECICWDREIFPARQRFLRVSPYMKMRG
ncbi:MAG: hypothetical protein Q4C61_17095 [Lachnospiraceae bacterium]|nr:hypothetical protein [Lachnospiraceae bacterium]